MLYIKKKYPSKEVVRIVSEIRSSQEWKKIESGNTKAIRAAFDQLPKEMVRQDLLEEQHYLCAYCMRKIKNDSLKTTIEHWYPLSKGKDFALDYGNMLAVCDGGKNWKGKGNRILCCDAYKSDEAELSISPLNQSQMSQIVYDSDGFIKIDSKEKKLKEDLEKDLNDILQLNGIWKNGRFLADTSTGLVKGRKDAYLRYKRWIRKLDLNGTCTSARIKKKIDEIEHEEQRQEYAGVLLYFLKKKYKTLIKRGL